MAQQMNQLSENFATFEVFKDELKDILNKIIGGHNAVAQELFVIRNNQANDEKFKNLENSFKKLADLVDSRTSTGSTEIPPTSGTSSQPSVSPPTAMSSPRVSPTNTATLNGATKASSKSSSETT